MGLKEGYFRQGGQRKPPWRDVLSAKLTDEKESVNWRKHSRQREQQIQRSWALWCVWRSARDQCGWREIQPGADEAGEIPWGHLLVRSLGSATKTLDLNSRDNVCWTAFSNPILPRISRTWEMEDNVLEHQVAFEFPFLILRKKNRKKSLGFWS